MTVMKNPSLAALLRDFSGKLGKRDLKRLEKQIKDLVLFREEKAYRDGHSDGWDAGADHW